MEMYLEELPRSFYGKSFTEVALYVSLMNCLLELFIFILYEEFVLNFE